MILQLLLIVALLMCILLIFGGCLDTLQYLIDEKVSDNKGHTPMHCAVLNDHLVTLQYLIDEKGADVTVTDNEGPYCCALCWCKWSVLLKYIDEKKADFTFANKCGKTPLHYPVDFYCRTPFHIFITTLNIFKYLVSNGTYVHTMAVGRNSCTFSCCA